ncbi:MAG TPA: DUF2199 domain-containing protein [Actinomycetota bacterium]|nr:DUF2199 domain-containing protein [Actinomycetota bacterium]
MIPARADRLCHRDPVHGREGPLRVGALGVLRPHRFRGHPRHWDGSDRHENPPYLGFLVTHLPSYPSTFGLDVLVHPGRRNERPTFHAEDKEHPLTIEQTEGITQARYEEIIATALHGTSPN